MSAFLQYCINPDSINPNYSSFPTALPQEKSN